MIEPLPLWFSLRNDQEKVREELEDWNAGMLKLLRQNKRLNQTRETPMTGDSSLEIDNFITTLGRRKIIASKYRVGREVVVGLEIGRLFARTRSCV